MAHSALDGAHAAKAPCSLLGLQAGERRNAQLAELRRHIAELEGRAQVCWKGGRSRARHPGCKVHRAQSARPKVGILQQAFLKKRQGIISSACRTLQLA